VTTSGDRLPTPAPEWPAAAVWKDLSPLDRAAKYEAVAPATHAHYMAEDDTSSARLGELGFAGRWPRHRRRSGGRHDLPVLARHRPGQPQQVKWITVRPPWRSRASSSRAKRSTRASEAGRPRLHDGPRRPIGLCEISGAAGGPYSPAGLCVTGYALVCRCLRDASPSDRPEILRALAELMRSTGVVGRGGSHRPPRSRRSE